MAEQIRDFRDLTVWQKAHRSFLDVAADVEAFSSTQTSRIIAGQILRSSRRSP
jgi:hypothetical protein